MSAITLKTNGFFGSEYKGPKLPEDLAKRYDDIMLAALREPAPRSNGTPYTAAEKAAYKAKEFLAQGRPKGDLSLFTLQKGEVDVFIDKMKEFLVTSQRDAER